MAKKEVGIDTHFEYLKKQVKEKKEIAEEIKDDVSKDNDINKNNDETVITNDNVNENKNADKHIDNDETINVDKDTNTYTNVNDNKNVNKIVIKKQGKEEQPKRTTYYLKPSTVKKIDKYSKVSGMGKSEFVQKLLDEAFELLEIEE